MDKNGDIIGIKFWGGLKVNIAVTSHFLKRRLNLKS